MAREDTYQHLKVFEDVVGMITSSYVEPVNVDKVMNGAMHGLADALDSDSAYLTADQVKQLESTAQPAAGDVGLELARQYYLRVIAARDNSPAAKAGLRTGDYIRMINDVPTREMSAWEGLRALRGAPGSKVTLTVIRGNAADPHVVELVREALPPSDVRSRMASPNVGYVRIAAISAATPNAVKTEIATLAKNGASSLIVDVRRTSTGSLDQGVALARLFVKGGTLALRERSGNIREPIMSDPADGTVTMPVTILIDTGTSAAAELFAAALSANQRADLVGEHTMGRAAVQRLIKLPDGSGLWLSTTRYLLPNGTPLHEKGLDPTLVVDEPDVEFGQQAPAGDPVLDKAIERLTSKTTSRIG
jgi:carboxyl-terminal processing protease